MNEIFKLNLRLGIGNIKFSPVLIVFYDSIKAYNLDNKNGYNVHMPITNKSYRQIVLGDTINRNSVMVAQLLVDKETSFIDPKSRFQKKLLLVKKQMYC